MLTFYAFDFNAKKSWRIRVSEAWYKRNDNGHAVSIGFVLNDDISYRQLEALTRRGQCVEVDYMEAIKPRPWSPGG